MSKTQINMDSPVFAGRLKTHVPEARVFNGGRAMSRRPVAMDILPRPHATARLPADKMAYKKTEPQRDNYVTRGSSSQQAPVQKYQTENYAKPATAEKQSKLKNGNLKSRALMVASVTLLIFGGWVSFSGLRTNQQAEAQVKHLTDTNSSNSDSAPDEKQPDPATFGSFKVSPSLPKYIKISKIGVNARVLRMSVNSKNQLMAPGNIYDAGWYENSAKPGDAGGAMLIDGHVHGPTKPGVFMNLKKLQAGDEITIVRGDDHTFKYKIVNSIAYDANNVDMNRLLVSADTSKPGLNLITCTGSIEKGTTEYTQRLAVFAVAE
jgi:LPXTG-site transpeptidase (sortase) family protein